MSDPRFEDAAWRAVELIRSELEQAEEQMKTASGEGYAYAKGRYDAARAILVALQLEEDPNTGTSPELAEAALNDPRTKAQLLGELRSVQEQIEALRSENFLLREEVRLHEESQIPKVPRAAAERMERLEEQLEAYRAALERIAGAIPGIDELAGPGGYYRETPYEWARHLAQTTLASNPASSPQAPSASQGDDPGAARRLATGASDAEEEAGTDSAPPRGVSSPTTEPETWKCANCGSDDGPHFDRSLCACGSMHNYCGACGQQDDPCDEQSPASEPEDDNASQ